VRLEEPHPAWLSSSKLDERTRESLAAFLAFHYAFSFDVTLARRLTDDEKQELRQVGVAIGSDQLVVQAQAAPIHVDALVALDAVSRLRCARGVGTTASTSDWMGRINVEAAAAWYADGCWITGHAQIGEALDNERIAQLSALGAFVAGREPPRVSVVVPRDALPALVNLPFIVGFWVEPTLEPNRGVTRGERPKRSNQAKSSGTAGSSQDPQR
jgi:hypothetical protein